MSKRMGNKAHTRAYLFCLLLGLACSLQACHKSVQQAPQGQSKLHTNEYAQGFRIDSISGFRILSITNAWNNHRETSRWLLVDSLTVQTKIPDSLLSIPKIHIPVQRIVALSSTHLALLQELRALPTLVGISRADLIHEPTIRAYVDSNYIAQVGYGPSIQIEQVVALKADLVLSFGIGDAKMDDYPLLQRAGQPVMVMSEWMEPHPLGRLEWIKLLGVLLKRESLADSIFAERVARYDSLVRITHKLTTKPTVMTGMPQAEIWYGTGGRNYFAQWMRDAGAQYLWDSDTLHGGLTTSFEQELERASNADVWLNPGIWNSRAQAMHDEPRVNLFKAWRTGKVFQYQKPGADFWDEGLTRPDLVLADLIQILHPELMPTYVSTFYEPLP
jgi:iron complex transport system substrate-binding protein